MTLPSMADPDFLEWVNWLKKKHFGGSFQRLADEVDVTYSALKRSVKNGSTSIETLLRISLATGEPQETVFTVAGKREVHELIRKLYGPALKLEFSSRAREVARLFDSLHERPDAQNFYFESMTKMAPSETASPSEHSAGTSSAKRAKGKRTAKRTGNRSQ